MKTNSVGKVAAPILMWMLVAPGFVAVLIWFFTFSN
jgi:hypothetical protein